MTTNKAFNILQNYFEDTDIRAKVKDRWDTSKGVFFCIDEDGESSYPVCVDVNFGDVSDCMGNILYEE